MIDEDAWVTSGGQVVVPVDGTAYIGSSASTVGAYTGHFVPVNTTTGELVATPHPLVDWEVEAILADGSGGWYIGGRFNNVDNQAQASVAHILADGSLDTSFTPDVDGPVIGQSVTALALDGGTLYVGGFFTAINGTPREGLAALDTSGNLLSWDPALSSASDVLVRALKVSGTTLYVGGSFEMSGVDTRYGMAAFDTTSGNLLAWDPGRPGFWCAGGFAYDLEVVGSYVYIAGNICFDAADHTNLSAVTADPTNASTAAAWAPKPDTAAEVLHVSGSTLYVGGNFSNLTGIPASRSSLAAFDLSVPADPPLLPWDPQADGTVSDIIEYGGTVYVGGQFTMVGGQSRPEAAAVTAGGTGTLLSWDPVADNEVMTFALSGSTLWMGGSFTHVNGEVRDQLFAIGPDGQATDWAPTADGRVEDMVQYGTDFYIGGSFAQVNGQSRTSLAAIDIATGSTQTFSATFDDWVTDLELVDSTLYVAGYFTLVNGQARNRLAAFDLTTGSLLSWSPGTNNIVNDLTYANNTIYAGGVFTMAQPQGGGFSARGRLAAFSTLDGSMLPWNPNVTPGLVLDTEIVDNTVYAAGSFSLVGNPPTTPRLGLAAFDATTGLVTSWDANLDGPGTLVEEINGIIYFSGLFSTFLGQTRNRFAAVDASTAQLISWDPNAEHPPGFNSSFVTDVAMGDEYLYAVGTFNRMNGQEHPGFARFALTLATFDQATSSVAEDAGSGTIPVSLSQADNDDITVEYSVTGGSATNGTDYTISNGTLTFSAGETDAAIPYTIIADQQNEADETVELTLSNPNIFGALGAQITHELTITEGEPIIRINADDPVDLAILISKENFPNDGEADGVVLARPDIIVDSFTVTPFASLIDATLLLNPTSGLDPAVLAEIERSIGPAPSAKPIYLAGGTDALSAKVHQDLADAGYQNIQRFPGAHRRETAKLIAAAIVGTNTTATTKVFLTEDQSFADALGTGGVAGNVEDGKADPVLITVRGDANLAPSVREFLTDNPQVTAVEIIGGTAAVSGSVAQAITNDFPSVAVTRTDGADRFETNSNLNALYFPDPVTIVVANGQSAGLPGASSVQSQSGASAGFFSALLAGRFAASQGGPLLISAAAELPASIDAYIAQNAASISRAYIVGTLDLISQAVEDRIRELIQ